MSALTGSLISRILTVANGCLKRNNPGIYAFGFRAMKDYMVSLLEVILG